MINFTKLRLHGFKSFVERTELDIGTGLTGIVGPNGCGKSNLVEALSWVMGETSAKRLRGGEMEDVIFAGTSGRPARNSAEVSVVLDNTSRKAPSMFNTTDEIEVVRRIERDMGSSYYVNGKSVRARDVQMLFADMAIGAHSMAIVSQNRITAVINAKPAERRQILEEAAGVSGLYVRRHEAELRLRAADANLARLQDILTGMESQLDSLKRQGRQATRYKNISTEIRTLETTLALAEWIMTQEAKAKAEHDFFEAESVVAERMATVAQLNSTQLTQAAEIPPLREKQTETAAAWQVQNFEMKRLDEEDQRIAGQINEAKNTLAQIKADSEHELQTAEENAKTVERIAEEEASLKTEGNSEEELARLAADRDTKESEVNRIQSVYQTAMEQAATSRASRSTLLNQLSQDDSRLQSIQNRLASLRSQIEQKKEERGNVVPLESISDEIVALEKDYEAKQEAETASRQSLEAAQQSLEDARAKSQTARETLSKIQAEMNALESVLNSETQQGFRPVLEDVKADEGFEAALAKALGDTLMASTETDAPMVWSSKASTIEVPAFPANVRALQPHIKAPAALQVALSFIGYVDSDADGDVAATQLKAGQSLVSREGAYWRWDGLTIRAKAVDRTAVRLKNKNRLTELQQQAAPAQAEVDKVQEILSGAQAIISDARQKVQTAEQETRLAERTLNNRRTDLQREVQKRSAAEAEIAKLEEGLSLNQDDLARLQSAVDTHKSSLQSFDEAALERQNAEVETHRQALSEAQNALREASTALEIFQQDKSRREARLRAIADERVNLNNRSIRARERVKQLEERNVEIQTRYDDLKSRPKEILQLRQNLLNNLSELENLKNVAADKLAAAERELDQTNKALKEAENALMEVRERRAHAQAMIEGATGSIEVLNQSIMDQFSMTPEELYASSEMTNEKITAEPVDRLRGKRDRLIRERDNMGPVNLRADVEATEVEQTLAKLSQEKAELTQAIEELRQGIQKLNKEARERLMAAFTTVNEHFQRLFTRLFGGGSAHLAFIESDDPLEAALEIFAQPPGKSLQSLSLLSGGEKTLASTALIFAMFLTNPAPICVLDEIDAPLDDANVDRVCSLLGEMSAASQTRFLMITHHRLTMAKMDRLYGVTMAERGVSQLVSVDLQQKLDFLEAAE
jgi:chromosome segregation protein